MAKNLFLIRGLSGSGKSTLAEHLANSMSDAIVLETDDWFYTYEAGTDEWCGIKRVYRFNPDKLAKYHGECQLSVKVEMVERRENIIVANTFTRQWEIQPYRDMAKMYGYTVTTITVDTGDLTDEQLAARNQHGVTADVIAKQRARWEV